MIRRALLGQQFVAVEEAFDLVRTLPHGHVAAVLGLLRKLRLDRMLAARRSEVRDLTLALVVGQVISPCSKLALSRSWTDWTLASELGVEDADADYLYRAMDWALQRQPQVEAQLAARHLGEDGMVLYDLTSSYFEGRTCPLAAYGKNRDGKRGSYRSTGGCDQCRGLSGGGAGVSEGNTGDPATLEIRCTSCGSGSASSGRCWWGTGA